MNVNNRVHVEKSQNANVYILSFWNLSLENVTFNESLLQLLLRSRQITLNPPPFEVKVISSEQGKKTLNFEVISKACDIQSRVVQML